MIISKYDQEIDIDLTELFDEMTEDEKEAMFWMLSNHFNESESLKSIDQKEFESALTTLKERYYAINKQDEQTILSISKKY